MRTLTLSILPVALILLFAPVGVAQQYQDQPQYEDEYGYDDGGDTEFAFFAELQSYGRWRVVASYGRVWQPYVTAGWQPYYYGNWAWTNRGWMWVSYEPFGWAVYHYGHWVYEPHFGWIWIAGHEWAPCHVQWVVYDDYICWAPLPPPGVHIGYPWGHYRYNPWITVHAYRFTEPSVSRYRVNAKFKSRYPERSAIHDAPDVRVVERFKGRAVPRVNVELEPRKSGGQEIYRPRLPREQEWVVEKHYRPTPPQAKLQGSSKSRSERMKPLSREAPSKGQAPQKSKAKSGKKPGR